MSDRPVGRRSNRWSRKWLAATAALSLLVATGCNQEPATSQDGDETVRLLM